MARTLAIDGDHLRRLMRLGRTLASGRGATLKQLQKRFKMSRRTVFRDLNALQEFGIDVELGEHGYRIRENAAVLKKRISDHNTKALSNLLRDCLK